ncbi:MAG TPA: M28 family peptidase [Vicinamibacterales bacterium]
MRALVTVGRAVAVAAVVTIILFACATAVIRQPIVTFGLGPQAAHFASADRLRRGVRFLTTAVRPRDVGHASNLNQASAYIANEFAGAGARVGIQEFTARRQRFRNVIAEFGPAESTEPLLIIGAHYDAFSDGGDFPGADDNASGASALVELARVLRGRRIVRPVMLVAYANEESPFFGSEEMGSAVHASSLEEQHRRVAGMICLEMIGYYTVVQRWDSWVLRWMYPRRGDFIGVAGGWSDRHLAVSVKRALASAGAHAVSFTGPRTMLDASDQRNYWSHRWPAVMVTDTAYERNPNYHTARDTAETLDYERMARVVDGLARFVTER